MGWLRLILISLFTGLSLGIGFWVAYFGCKRLFSDNNKED